MLKEPQLFELSHYKLNGEQKGGPIYTLAYNPFQAMERFKEHEELRPLMVLQAESHCYKNKNWGELSIKEVPLGTVSRIELSDLLQRYYPKLAKRSRMRPVEASYIVLDEKEEEQLFS